LGLLMLRPLLALYNEQLRHSPPLRLCLAIGIYGLAQAAMSASAPKAMQ
ncbi:MAG: hypothetical protein GJU75_12300, partial [Acidithiobacillus ferriphilus]|nr:hypothetical protein [Acidithiobacillus ferriphilus]